MNSHEVNTAGDLFLFSLVGSWLTAVTFVVVFTWTLPPTDGMYGQAPFQDPLVFPVMAMGAMFFTLVTLPFAVLFLRRVEPARGAAIVLAAALVTTVATAPFLALLTAPVAFLATLAAMAFCRSRFPRSEAKA